MIYGNINSPMYEDQAAVLPPLLREVLRFLKETPVYRQENRGFFQKPGMLCIPGDRVMIT